LGLFSSVVTNYTLSVIEAFKVSVFSNLSTIMALVAGALFLGEKIDYDHIIGAFFVIVDISGVNLKRSS
jgi:drug/metabolite transporter (DMT)-like permease